MPTLSVVIPPTNGAHSDPSLKALVDHSSVIQVIELGQSETAGLSGKVRIIKSDSYSSGETVQRVLDACSTDYLLWSLPGSRITFGARAIERLLQVAADSGAGWLYSDFREANASGEVTDHPLIDYQLGSIRDNFDFGSALLISRAAAVRAIERHGAIAAELRWGGLYDLRLKVSVDSQILRVPEPLYTRAALDTRASGEKIFDYVDPRQRNYQIEMERVATAHLKRINAYLEPEFAAVPATSETFPVKASVVIPVRNREKTIADAVRSVLSQQTDFGFNLIVVDNHSTDGTTAILRELAANDARLIHLIPERTDYGIGGCWNEALYSPHCGRYLVQLDSDDIYTDARTLAKVVAKFDEGGYAMVIGSYTVVDFDLNELPPGLIDHREWTRENGRNNALRINGLGAPRAFDVTVLRDIGLPNVSYGEDYAVALRISRDYEIHLFGAALGRQLGQRAAARHDEPLRRV
jgi:hypothetical protein